jgi:hypothetical protein
MAYVASPHIPPVLRGSLAEALKQIRCCLPCTHTHTHTHTITGPCRRHVQTVHELNPHRLFPFLYPRTKLVSSTKLVSQITKLVSRLVSRFVQSSCHKSQSLCQGLYKACVQSLCTQITKLVSRLVQSLCQVRSLSQITKHSSRCLKRDTNVA